VLATNRTVAGPLSRRRLGGLTWINKDHRDEIVMNHLFRATIANLVFDRGG
jgi:hypothetical protein